MSAKIRVLPDHIINQIAAGEVIENPASVIKELIENGVDAGASKIVIEIKGGGQQLIRVSDDGSGMNGDDAVLCLERHATSKIKSVDDLLELQTMGFRGEALASIGAISKMTITTSLGTQGTKVEVEGGRLIRVEPAPRTRGTTIEVRSLFYNVPARKKFQKSAALNAAEISRMVSVLSLAYPEIGFELVLQERSAYTALAAAGISFEEALNIRAGHILGEKVLSFQVATGGLKGIIASPEQSRRNRTGQYLFINRRSVFCPAISYAVKDGYATRLAADRFPVFVLHLTLPPDRIDVNVHPQKREIRLQGEAELKEQIKESIALSLQREEGVFASAPPVKIFSDFSFSPAPARTENFIFKEEALPSAQLPLIQEPVRPVGIFDHYLLVEAASVAGRIEIQGDGVLLVDLIAARARVAYEAMIKNHSGEVKSQGLIFPIRLELPALEAELIHAHLEEIGKLGIDIRATGDESFAIDALPEFIDPDDAQELILEMAEKESGPLRLAQIASRFVGARKNGFMLQEAIALFEKLLATSSPYRCPEGKKIIAHLSRYEIGKFF